MPVLLDTHAWVWWVTADKRLSAKARRLIESARRSNSLFVSAISIWEVAKKVDKKQLVLDRNLDLWLDQAIDNQRVQIADISRVTMVESCRLPPPFTGDFADQIIVATARGSGMTLVSKDRRIRSYKQVESLW
jgi:PIN domain nuclease of toxin-antitoxin system